MEIRESGIEGLYILEPKVFADDRGYFFESYRKNILAAHGFQYDFVQDNQSRSAYGVIRGLHFQAGDHAQAKLIRVVEGTIYDVAVDIRAGSESYGHWFGVELSADNHMQMLIPRGFAHGFSVLSAYATIMYKCDAYYHKASESGIRFNDPDLAIDWQLRGQKPVVSPKDLLLPLFKDI